MHIKFWSKNVTGRGHLEDSAVDGRMMMMMMKMIRWRRWNGLVRLRIGTSGGLLGKG